jgi:hypothetical protein
MELRSSEEEHPFPFFTIPPKGSLQVLHSTIPSGKVNIFLKNSEFDEGGILPSRQIFRPTALGSLEEGLARGRLCN